MNAKGDLNDQYMDDFEEQIKLSPILQRDILDEIFKRVPFTDKTRFERVCKVWQEAILSSHLKQTSIGNSPVKYSTLDRCHVKEHLVTRTDIVKKIHLTNPSVLMKILAKCKNIKSIHIVDSCESCYIEPTAPRGDEPHPYPENQSTRNQRDRRLRATYGLDDFCRVFEEEDAHTRRMRHLHHRFHRESEGGGGPDVIEFNCRDHWPSDSSLRDHLRASVQGFISPVDRERTKSPFDGLIDVISTCQLECLDLSGLKLDGDRWVEFRSFYSTHPIKQYLKHLKCGYLSESSLRSILNELPIREISAVRPATGISLSTVPATLTKLAIKSLHDRGLEAYAKTPFAANLQQLFLCDTSDLSVSLLCNFTNLVSINLSFSEKLSNPHVIRGLRHLDSLQHLYLKFRCSFFDTDGSFDRSLRSFFSASGNLKSLRLVNCPLEDETFKTITTSHKQLQLFDYRAGPEYKTGYMLLNYLLLSPQLRTCYISCINTFSETTVIQMLIEAKFIRKLVIHGCTELIPDNNIFFAALRRARSSHDKLSIEIQIEDQMSIHIAKTSFMPSNLKFTMRTLTDFYTTQSDDSSRNWSQLVPTGRPLSRDFDDEVAN